MRHEDADLNRVLKEDGVSLVDAFEQINLASTSLREVKAKWERLHGRCVSFIILSLEGS
jgi:hypothetical protein